MHRSISAHACSSQVHLPSMPPLPEVSQNATSPPALARQIARGLEVLVLTSTAAIVALCWLASGNSALPPEPAGLAIALGWGLICVPLGLRGSRQLGVLGELARAILAPPLPASTEEPATATAPVSASRMQELIDAMDAGVVWWDADDRLLLCNRNYRALYCDLAPAHVAGESYETILRMGVEKGLLPQAVGQESAWIDERLRQHAEGSNTALLEVKGTWRRITEQRLSDGTMLAFSIDVTELVRQGSALADARQSALAAAQRLEDAIEALPDGLALYDADDRLSMCNTRYRAMYAGSAPVLQVGTPFEAILRYRLEHGQYPAARGANQIGWPSASTVTAARAAPCCRNCPATAGCGWTNASPVTVVSSACAATSPNWYGASSSSAPSTPRSTPAGPSCRR
jgi:PAS domain-containing protein